MLIRMKQQMSGGRHDGKPWPPPFTPFEVPDWEGRDLILGGMADPYGKDAEQAARKLREQPTAGHPSKLDEREADAPAEAEPAPELPGLAGAEADEGGPGDGAADAGQAAAEAPADPAPPGAATPAEAVPAEDAPPGNAPAETSPAEDVPAPTPASPKQAWVDYAVSQGADVHAALQMTKADLMSRYGGRL